MARQQADANLRKGASGKLEYTQRQMQFEECQVPAFFTTDYSIFAERWADSGDSFGHRIEPLFIEVFPPESASEIEAVFEHLSKVFKQYENLGVN